MIAPSLMPRLLSYLLTYLGSPRTAGPQPRDVLRLARRLLASRPAPAPRRPAARTTLRSTHDRLQPRDVLRLALTLVRSQACCLRASAPPTMSRSSLVMRSWRALLYWMVSTSIISLAFLVAASMAVMRAPYSPASDSMSAW